MKYNTYSLPNGLRIIHLPSVSPILYCGYQINAGTRNELHGEEGMAHFCEHTTFKGTTHRKAWHIMNCLERVGGDLNAFTNKEDTVYYAAIHKDHIAKAIDLLSDIVFHSIYPQAEIDKEIEVICDEIESYNDSPAELIYDEIENLLFEGHPLGHNILGQAEHLRTYKSEDAKRFTTHHYYPSNMIFFAYGDIDFKQLVRLIKKATADISDKTINNNANKSTLALALPQYTPRNITIDKATHQAHVMIANRAYDIHDKRRIPLYLLNNILGGPGMNARFNMSLREKHALVYNVESTMVSYSDTGLWCTYFGCDPHDINHCLKLIRKELNKMMDKPLSSSQLNAAKKQIKGQIAIACDNRESFALDFGKSYLHYGWERDINSLFARIDSITAYDIQNVAQDIFQPEKLTTLIYK